MTRSGRTARVRGDGGRDQGRWRGSVGLLVALVAVFGWQAAVARADVSPLAWSPYRTIEPFTSMPQTALGPVSCIAQTLCVAGDGNWVMTSMDPTGGSGGWTLTQVGASGMTLTGMSCPTISMCVAVDSAGDVVTTTDPIGGSAAWTTTAVDAGNQLASVSCASTALCIAVDNAGNVVASTNPAGGAAAWHVSNIDSHAFWSVSCAASSLCVAVGDSPSSVFTSTDPAGGGAHWSATTVTGLTQGLQTVSCPSTTSCVALDGSANIVTSSNPIGGTAAWSYATGPTFNGGFLSLSCTTAVCVAVDQNGHVITSTNPSGGGTAWIVTSSPVAPAKLAGVSCTSASLCVASARPGGLSYGSIITTTTPATGGSGWTEAPVQATISLFGISCASASLCFAVDTRGDVLNSTDPTGGTVWAATNVTGTNLYGIACPSVSLCVGVDYTGNVLTSANPTGDHSAWTSASVDGRIPINAVACPSAGLCVAVDDAGNVLTSTDPTAGAAAWHLVNIDGTTPMGAVACASTTMCVAGDDRGNVIASTDPTGGSAAWHAAQVDGTNSFNGVSCPSTTLCAAVDDVGNVVTATDPTGGAAAWRAASVDPGNPLTAVSCSSPSQCVAVDASGNEINSIDPAGGDPAWTGTQVGVSPSPLGGPGPSPLQAISCPIESYCIAVDGYGYAFVGKPTPSNLTPPSISGSDAVGGVLQETNGSWTDSPTSSDVYWESCDSTGDHCSLIQGASGQTYTLTSADLGRTIRAIEVASNANGHGTPVESNPSAVVTLPQPPTSTSPPRIAGTATQGQRLSETHGSWTNSPTTYHYQWSDCDVAGNNCASIATATGQTYTLTAADVGHTIRVEEIAGNVGGSSAPTTSAPTGVVQVPSGTSGALTAGRASVSGPSARLSVSCIGGPGATCKLTLALTITETVKAGKVVAVTATKRNGTKPKRKIVTLSTTTITLTAGQAENVQLGLNGTGKRLLAKYHTLKVKLLITESGRTVSAQTITFKARHQRKKH